MKLLLLSKREVVRLISLLQQTSPGPDKETDDDLLARLDRRSNPKRST